VKVTFRDKKWQITSIILAVALAISVVLNAFLYFGVVKPLETQINDMQKSSLSLWDVKKNPEKYLGERDVLLTLVGVKELATLSPSGVVYSAQVQDSYGYEVDFYIPYALVDAYRLYVDKNTMFHLNGSKSSYPLHGIAPEEPAFNSLVNEKQSDGMWNTITIELIIPEAYTTYGVFKLSIRLEKSEFNVGEIIQMNISLTNIGHENETISFSSSPQPNQHWFWRVYNENHQVVFYYKYVPMIPAFQEETLEPGESMQVNREWDQRDTNTEQQVSPGRYYLLAAVGFYYNGEEVTLETEIKIIIQ